MLSTCQLSSTVRSQWHWAPTFVYNTSNHAVFLRQLISLLQWSSFFSKCTVSLKKKNNKKFISVLQPKAGLVHWNTKANHVQIAYINMIIKIVKEHTRYNIKLSCRSAITQNFSASLARQTILEGAVSWRSMVNDGGCVCSTWHATHRRGQVLAFNEQCRAGAGGSQSGHRRRRRIPRLLQHRPGPASRCLGLSVCLSVSLAPSVQVIMPVGIRIRYHKMWYSMFNVQPPPAPTTSTAVSAACDGTHIIHY